MIPPDDGTPAVNPCVVSFERFEEHRLKLDRLRRTRRGMAGGGEPNDDVDVTAVRNSIAGPPVPRPST